MTTTFPPPPAGLDEKLLQQLAQHSALQQMWLSGYLYGIASNGHQAPNGVLEAPSVAVASQAAAVPSLPQVTILYGSQTGNSKKVAQQLSAKVKERGFQVVVADLNDYQAKNLKSEKIVLLVISTQGEGEPPIAAEEFHKWLLGTRAPQLDGVQFAVCALGDRSYLQFCQTGKEIDARLEVLGAKRLVDRVDCDVDYEEAVEGWLINVLGKLPAPVSVPAALAADTRSAVVHNNGQHAAVPAAKAAGTPLYDRKKPFSSPILEKIQLNGRGSQKETWHLELSLEGSGLVYEPGDSLAIYADNSESLVKEVLYTAMLNGNKTVTYNGAEREFRQILQQEVELSVLTREVVDQYANWTNNAKLKAIVQDNAALKNFLWGRNVADLLREFPAALSEATLLGFLRKMPPRSYSIASSLLAHPDEVHLTVAAVRYDFNGRPHQGVASTFLADRIKTGESLPVFLEHNEYFKLPADDATDIIMVGPGTGVAPFRAFVEERSERGATGKNWLFFGNPHFETDFLYQIEWLNHLKRGTLDRLDVAFSRDQKDKIYVQNRLAERSRLIYERLENGAHFYVCGDKTRMASDVQYAVSQIVAKESGKGDEYATEYLKNLKKQRRYLEDVY